MSPWFPDVRAPYIVFERWDGDDLDNLDFFIPLTSAFLDSPNLSEDLRVFSGVLLSWGFHTYYEFDSPRNGINKPGVFFVVRSEAERVRLQSILKFPFRPDVDAVGCFFGRGKTIWRENVRRPHCAEIYENGGSKPVAKEIFTTTPPAWVQRLRLEGSTLHHYKIPLVRSRPRKAYFRFGLHG